MSAGNAEKKDYWQTAEGILSRFGMLANDVQLGTFNDAVKVFGMAMGFTAFKISGALKPASCQWCINHVGNVYRGGQFMPDLPRHPGCLHYYDIQPALSPSKKQRTFFNLPSGGST